MPQESTPCLPPCQCRKPKRTSAGKGTQANGEEALLYPAERFCGWGKTGSENGRDRTNIPVPSALSGTLPSSLADDNARKKKYMHGATAVNVMLSQTQGSTFPEEAGNCSGRGQECMRQ